MKIRLVGTELCHADRQTGGHDESSTRFGNFPKAPKECVYYYNVNNACTN
jgi:hypothetical protein